MVTARKDHKGFREIDVDDPADVMHWVDVLDTTREGLLAAVAEVGRDPVDVRNFLTRGSSAEPPGTPEQAPDGG